MAHALLPQLGWLEVGAESKALQKSREGAELYDSAFRLYYAPLLSQTSGKPRFQISQGVPVACSAEDSPCPNRQVYLQASAPAAASTQDLIGRQCDRNVGRCRGTVNSAPTSSCHGSCVGSLSAREDHTGYLNMDSDIPYPQGMGQGSCRLASGKNKGSASFNMSKAPVSNFQSSCLLRRAVRRHAS